jgi:hypothetical protein
VNHAVAETAFVQQLELEADLAGESLDAAAHHDGRDDEVDLVDQPGLDRLSGEIGTAHDQVAPADAFSCRTASGSNSRSIRVLALETVSSVFEYTILSAPRQISAKSWMKGGCSARREGFPGDQHLVQPAPEEEGAHGPIEVVNKAMHFLVRLGPVEPAVLVRYKPSSEVIVE